MGNESSKSKLSTVATKHGTLGKTKLSLGIKHGPSSTIIQRHLEIAQKSRILQLRNSGMKIIPEQLQEVGIFFSIPLYSFIQLRSTNIFRSNIRITDIVSISFSCLMMKYFS